jgi:haloacetate dehalogenase
MRQNRRISRREDGSMFEGFDRREVALDDATLAVITGGAGPPLLLLHGYPQTQACWHAVAPALAERFSLVIPDLPGYGASRGPAPEAANYSKRSLARIMTALMSRLGHKRFSLAGHDRGARIGFRLALDHPERVHAFAALDIVPTLSAWEAMDWKRALGSYHWLFLAQPAPLPERMIGQDPDFYINHLLDRWAGDRGALNAGAVAEYVRHFRKPSVIAATCADYRAGMSHDVEHDADDRRAGRRIRCPTLVVWGRGYLTDKVGSPLATWRAWADDVSEAPLDCGHFVAEEQPAACATALAEFFGRRAA